MSTESADFIHPNHLSVFVAAAQTFDCHILVRKTGRAALGWVGKRGYTGKRADLKAKTANVSFGRHHVAGLVCSPALLPQAFTSDRLGAARREWAKSAHLITVPGHGAGFGDLDYLRDCRTPYIVQTDRSHRHYGCVALVDMGLLVPRYVHGDYDLYAIIPAGKSFDPAAIQAKQSSIGSTMRPSSMGLRQQLGLAVDNLVGPLSFQVANFVNNGIARRSPDLLGSLMVNHGEQLNIGAKGRSNEPVLAVMPAPLQGQSTRVLATQKDHESFYRSV